MGKKKTGKASSEYEVGRGKPPLHTRYPSGKSGNPGGRQKGSVNLKTLLERVLNSEIVLSENGKPRRVTVIEAVLLNSAKTALAGNQRSIEFLVDKYQSLDAQNETLNVELAQDDQDLLDAALLARQQSIGAGASPPQRPSDGDNPGEDKGADGSEELEEPVEGDPEDDGSDKPDERPTRRSGSTGRGGRS